MKVNYDRFCLSHCLARHPLLAEKTIVRLKYLNVLAYFIEKYTDNDIIARAAFENYKTAFMYTGGIYKRLEQKKDGTVLRYILKYQLRKFKFFSFRYVLLCDLVMLICPFDEAKALEIANEMKTNLNKTSGNNIDLFLQSLFHSSNQDNFFLLPEYHVECWNRNKLFINNMPEKKIIISSNMSSGKSTLINALVGKRINRSMNEACTSKLHYIYDKPFEDNFIHEFDYDLEMNADIAVLMENNEKNTENIISVASYFRLTGSKKVRLCVIDSPGVNNSLDTGQEDIKRLIVGQDFKVFLYVINAEYIGTTDDFVYLEYIKNNIRGKSIVFVVNKLDRFRLEEDNIEESINKIRDQLASMGFPKPTICPISAYTGYMAKRKLFENDLSEDNLDEYDLLSGQFRRPEYDLSKYYDPEIKKIARTYVEKADENTKNEMALLYKSGFLCLETLLQKGETK
ncbi:hypothetical protein AGMMS49991_09950 [Spirochaetia bacterium]|nr:hypothetical protein AGMMS49991_09950 [Spirochaetia bacterium]